MERLYYVKESDFRVSFESVYRISYTYVTFSLNAPWLWNGNTHSIGMIIPTLILHLVWWNGMIKEMQIQEHALRDCWPAMDFLFWYNLPKSEQQTTATPRKGIGKEDL